MMGPGGGASSSADPNFQATVDQGADVFAKQLEESGIPPGDFLKQLLADVMAEEGGSGSGASAENLAAAAAAAGISAPSTTQGSSSTPAAGAGAEQPADSFNDAIKRTMGRMKESGDKATAAASNEDDISEDMLAQLLKAVEAGASGAGEDGDLSKMFMGMMEQLSNKEMLYEPMKELDVKFGPWIEKNKGTGKVSAEDMERFETQARVVKQIVGKFEEKGFSDDDPKCREYVWERMQEVSCYFCIWVERSCFGGSFTDYISRCKRLEARLRNSFRIPSWKTWEVRPLVLPECLIARNSDMILKLYDRSLKGRYRLDAEACLFLLSLIHRPSLYCTYAQPVSIYPYLLDVYIRIPISPNPNGIKNANPMQCLAKKEKSTKSTLNQGLACSRHVHILGLGLTLIPQRLWQSHKDIIILIITEEHPGPIRP